MTDTAQATETEAPEAKKQWSPNPQLTHRSLAKYVTEHSGIEITPEQAQAVLAFHPSWQKSPERVLEREAEKAEKAKAAEQAKAERAQKAAEKAEAAAKAKATAEAKKAAQDAADAGDDADLDNDDDTSEPAKVRAPRRRKGGTSEAEF